MVLDLDVPRAFHLPRARADAAAARAALAGVTRLEVSGGEPDAAQLAAAVLRLPGLRAVSLVHDECDVGERGDDALYVGPGALGSDLLDALAGCPRLESLEWDLRGWLSNGAPVLRCTGFSKRSRGGQWCGGAGAFQSRWGA
jgi:hypothetical protein